MVVLKKVMIIAKIVLLLVMNVLVMMDIIMIQLIRNVLNVFMILTKKYVDYLKMTDHIIKTVLSAKELNLMILLVQLLNNAKVVKQAIIHQTEAHALIVIVRITNVIRVLENVLMMILAQQDI